MYLTVLVMFVSYFWQNLFGDKIQIQALMKILLTNSLNIDQFKLSIRDIINLTLSENIIDVITISAQTCYGIRTVFKVISPLIVIMFALFYCNWTKPSCVFLWQPKCHFNYFSQKKEKNQQRGCIIKGWLNLTMSTIMTLRLIDHNLSLHARPLSTDFLLSRIWRMRENASLYR